MMQDSQVSATTLQMRDEEDHIRRIFDEVRQTSPVQLRRSVIYRGLPGSVNAQLRRRGIQGRLDPGQRLHFVDYPWRQRHRRG